MTLGRNASLGQPETDYTILRFEPETPFGDRQLDVAQVDELVAEQEMRQSFLKDEDWTTVPLINRSGDQTDHRLEPLGRAGTPTPCLSSLPWTREAVAFLHDHGMTVEHARLLVLKPGGLFWPHVDAHAYFRVLLPLACEDDQCFYFIEDDIYATEVGKFYYLQPDVCHAALNFSDTSRAVICLDVTVDRKSVEYLLRYAEIPAPFTGRFPFSKVIEQNLRTAVSKIGEVTPDFACKFSFLLGLCCFDASIKDMYSLLHKGLSACDEERMTPEVKARNQGLIEMISKHPYFPRHRQEGTPTASGA